MKMERLTNAGYMWIGWHIWILIGGHSHRNKRDRRVFQRGIVHVQAYKIKDGVPWRDSFNARSMNNEEMRKFGRILKKACPTVKFR